MIDLEQKVKIKWFTRNKQRYEKLGYKFTGYSTGFFVNAKDLEINSSKKVTVKCDECDKEIITPYRNYNRIVKEKGKYRCRKCNAPLTSDIRINNNKVRQLKDFENMVNKKGYTSIAKIDDYNGSYNPMPFICDKHGVQYLSINQLRQGCSCPRCRTSSNKLSINEIKKRIFEKNGDFLLNPEEYIDAKTSNLKIKCGSCDNEFITSFASIRNSNGYCSQCAIKNMSINSTLSKEKLIENTTRNGICYLINPNDYKNSNTKNLKFKCDTCDSIFCLDYTHYRLGQIYCKKCTTKINSIGEYLIIKCLDKYNIEYKQQYRISECRYKRPLPFDFYLPKYNLLIEFDGWQHYHMTNKDTQETFQLRKTRDQIKTDYCKNNNIDLLRISYLERDNIEEILKEHLKII